MYEISCQGRHFVSEKCQANIHLDKIVLNDISELFNMTAQTDPVCFDIDNFVILDAGGEI